MNKHIKMIEKEIEKLIKKGKSRNLEFKESLSVKDEIGESVSAFSNTCKGIILIGVPDLGEIKGIQIGKRTIEELANYIKQNTDNSVFSDIKVEKVGNKSIIIIEVNEADEKPVFFKGKAYARIGNSNHKLSASNIRKLAKESAKSYWDEQICKEASLEDIDKKKVEWYLRQREKYRNISEEIKLPFNQFLENIKVIKNGKPTNAGILFFGKYPQKFLPNARLRVIKFKGTKIINPTLDTANCEGTLLEMMSTAEDFIRKNIRLLGTRTEKSFRREDKFEYPMKALREALINALIHRNYSETGDVRVFIFDNRVEVINPGSFPEGVTPKNPKHKPVNEILCQLVYDTGFIEKYGSGIYMMKSLCNKWENKEPYYELHPIETKIIFESPIKETTFIEIEAKLNDRQKRAIEYIKKKGSITNKEYREINSVSNRIAFEELYNLIKKEILIRKGKGRSVYYVFK